MLLAEVLKHNLTVHGEQSLRVVFFTWQRVGVSDKNELLDPQTIHAIKISAGGKTFLGCNFFACLRLEAFCLQLSVLLTVVFGSSFAYSLSFFTCSSSFFCLQVSFFACDGKVCLRSTSADCKQRSSTVSNKARAVSKKASPHLSLSSSGMRMLKQP